MSKARAVFHLIFAKHWYLVVSATVPKKIKMEGIDGTVINTDGLAMASGYEEVKK